MINIVYAILDAYDGKSRDVGRIREGGRASNRAAESVCPCHVHLRISLHPQPYLQLPSTFLCPDAIVP
jgi:hypothetical protein